MKEINGIPIRWDHEADKKLFGGLFPSGLNTANSQNERNSLESIRTTKTFDEISNDYAFNSPLGKESIFYKAKEGSLRRFFSDKDCYDNLKDYFKNIDLENVLISGSVATYKSESNPYFCDNTNVQIVQHTVNENFEGYFDNLIDQSTLKFKSYLDNFTWFLEGNASSTVAFHFFCRQNYIEEIICTMGSDIFDCLKNNTNLNATGGFTIKDEKEQFIVNPVLDGFKKSLIHWAKETYNGSAKFNPKFDIKEDLITNAINQEFKAEGDYQRAVDWIFEKMEITTSFKDFVNSFRDDSK